MDYIDYFANHRINRLRHYNHYYKPESQKTNQIK